jgi:hypothetical protein
MGHSQDPQKQTDFLQQCFSSNKKPLGIFLGAGCPMGIRLGGEGNPPLMPDVAGITKVVRDSLAKSRGFKLEVQP